MCVKSVLFCLSVSFELLRIQVSESISHSGMVNEKSPEFSSCLSGCKKTSSFFPMESAVPPNKCSLSTTVLSKEMENNHLLL